MTEEQNKRSQKEVTSYAVDQVIHEGEKKKGGFILPDTGLVRLKSLLEVIPMSRSTLYDRLSREILPRPLKIGRSTYWRAEDIRQFLANLPYVEKK